LSNPVETRTGLGRCEPRDSGEGESKRNTGRGRNGEGIKWGSRPQFPRGPNAHLKVIVGSPMNQPLGCINAFGPLPPVGIIQKTEKTIFDQCPGQIHGGDPGGGSGGEGGRERGGGKTRLRSVVRFARRSQAFGQEARLEGTGREKGGKATRIVVSRKKVENSTGKKGAGLYGRVGYSTKKKKKPRKDVGRSRKAVWECLKIEFKPTRGRERIPGRRWGKLEKKWGKKKRGRR